MITETFECGCECHRPMGFKLVGDQRPSPGMRPCARCVARHEAWEVDRHHHEILRSESATGRVAIEAHRLGYQQGYEDGFDAGVAAVRNGGIITP